MPTLLSKEYDFSVGEPGKGCRYDALQLHCDRRRKNHRPFASICMQRVRRATDKKLSLERMSLLDKSMANILANSVRIDDMQAVTCYVV